MLDRRRGPGGPIYFTVPQLAKMAGVTPYQMRGLLAANEVPVGRTGQNARRGVVYRASLEAALPDLMDSIRGRR